MTKFLVLSLLLIDFLLFLAQFVAIAHIKMRCPWISPFLG